MEQAVAEHTPDHRPDHRQDTPAELAQFDQVAKTGWQWFTKFLLWNVLACVAILLFIGLLTVWS